MLAQRQSGACRSARPAASARRGQLVVRAAAATKAAEAKFIPQWTLVYDALSKRGLRTVAPEEAAALLEKGDWVLVDVRRPDQYEESRPEGAVSVPMYRLIDMSKPDLKKVMRTIAYSFNGVQAIEPNEDFVPQALAALGGKKAVLLCEAGGTMRATVNFPAGKSSRSLQAAYKLIAEGGLPVENVVHLERGLYGWYQADLPIAGEYKPDVGRTPMAAADPAIANASAGAAYDVQAGDKPAAEPEKKKFFGLF